MSDDELDLSEFEEFSPTARQAAGKASQSGASPAGGGPKGRKSSGGGSGPRRWVWLLVGLVLGVAGTVYLPGLAAPYLPVALRPGVEEVRGPVLGKRVESGRVLLTVDGSRGALLATFRQRVSEIDLLVEEGDTVLLRIEEYAPLVEDPGLLEVRKGSGPDADAPETGIAGGGPDREDGTEPAEPADTSTSEVSPGDGAAGQDGQDDPEPVDPDA